MTKFMSWLFAAALVTIVTPGVALAAELPCVTKLKEHIREGGAWCPVAEMRMVKMTRNGSWVSFTDAKFKLNAAGRVVTDKIRELFSDRYDGYQPFAFLEYDEFSLDLAPATSVMTVRNYRWDFTRQVTLSCNGDLLVGNDDGIYYVISHRPGRCDFDIPSGF